MNKLRSKFNNKIFRRGFVSFILLISAVIIFTCLNTVRNGIDGQEAGRTFGSGHDRYSCLSVYFSPGKAESRTDIMNVRKTILDRLKEDSYEVDYSILNDRIPKEPNTKKIWTDSFAAKGEVTISHDKNSINALAYGVSGDFFLIDHPELVSGSYFYDSDTNHDRIVIDENLAFAIFGSSDIAGKSVKIGNITAYIAGVSKVPEKKPAREAYGTKNRIFMPYDMLCRAAGSGTDGNISADTAVNSYSSSGSTGIKSDPAAGGSYASGNESGEAELPIIMYQALLPDPVPNYAKNIVSSAFSGSIAPVPDSGSDTDDNGGNGGTDLNGDAANGSVLNFSDSFLVENTGRYKAFRLFQNIKAMRYRTMHTDNIELPYWENYARYSEEKIAAMYVIFIILLIYPVIFVIGLTERFFRTRKHTLFGLIKAGYVNVREKHYTKLYNRKHKADEDNADENHSITADNEMNTEDHADNDDSLPSEKQQEK
jgi:hypothetical protein